ncbi:hypothetical protein BJ994_000301 [Arthrobacter pigmenti]|uniref:Uncharacterized protein n=1 Tax=Arthrobacter pigmenti TaxID=271432 RepID=A0A846RN28_9MICC|nr:hypothetical protein [Arthrobacter pigmenti]NJC21225.1 hypothetical protein [Arthrobacter pigmenti]
MNDAARLHKRTLTVGIALGVLGLLVLLVGDYLLLQYGAVSFQASNGFFFFLTRLSAIGSVALLPFSAALVSAALVMKYWDKRLQALGAPDEDDDAGPDLH